MQLCCRTPEKPFEYINTKIELDFVLTWRTEDIKNKAGQHERKDRSVTTVVSISELLSPLSDDGHFHATHRKFLQQSHNI